MGACANDKKDARDWQSEGSEVFAAGGASSDSPGGWSIFLESVAADATPSAEQRAVALRSALGRDDITVRRGPRGSAVVLGSYAGTDDPRAQADLRAVRAATVQGKPLFSKAYLLPPEFRADDGGNPKISLAGLRRERGPGRLYTLQIAVYESDDPAEAKRAAEQAAEQLRAEGDPAYYHHGPNRSMVTIGAFTPREFDPAAGVVSPALAQYQRKYPNNLLNGRTSVVAGRNVPSQVVEVPK